MYVLVKKERKKEKCEGKEKAKNEMHHHQRYV